MANLFLAGSNVRTGTKGELLSEAFWTMKEEG